MEGPVPEHEVVNPLWPVVPGVGVLLVPEGGEHRVEARTRVLLHQRVTQHRPA